MVDFTNIMNKKALEVEKPPLKPAGTYLGSIAGAPSQKEVKTKDGDKPVVTFNVKLMAPQQDVDQDALSNEKLGEVSSWPPFNHDIWVDGPEGEFRLRKFLQDTLKIDPGTVEDSKTLGEMCGEAAGRQVMVTLIMKPYTDRDGQPAMANNIGSIAAV